MKKSTTRDAFRAAMARATITLEGDVEAEHVRLAEIEAGSLRRHERQHEQGREDGQIDAR
jgi:hypothetical protein